MGKDHALLTARDIHGPYMQLFTNLKGDNGHEWLKALKKFNKRINPWEKGYSSEIYPAEFILKNQGRVTFADAVLKDLDLSSCPPSSRSLYVAFCFRVQHEAELSIHIRSKISEQNQEVSMAELIPEMIKALNAKSDIFEANKSSLSIFYIRAESGRLFPVCINWSCGSRLFFVDYARFADPSESVGPSQSPLVNLICSR